MKTIGLLTSGGDAPGMNACIATIAAGAEARGVSVRGIMGGFEGLASANTIPIGGELSGLARRGGTFLGTSRNGQLKHELQEHGVATALSRCGIEGLIVLGGGGSMGAAAELAKEGVPVVGVPCTIDNDIAGTDYCLGFDTAVSKGLRAADEIMDTAESLAERVFLIETLGGNTGHIALAAAYASNADAAFVHEVPGDVPAAAAKIKARMDAGATNGLVFACEGLGTDRIAADLQRLTGRRVRVTVLGHTQRGGSPGYLDRCAARVFGEAAIEALLSGRSGSMVAMSGGEPALVALGDIAGKKRELDMRRYNAVNSAMVS